MPEQSPDSPDSLVRAGYTSAREAMATLGVRPQTLYAYVSRGLIRSISQSGKRDRLYLREDVDRLSARSLARSGHGAVAASAMHWGQPIIPTAITEITQDGPRYRGQLASDLARQGASFESVAELLWTGRWNDEVTWPAYSPGREVRAVTESLGAIEATDQVLEVFALLTLHLGLGRGSVAERVRNGRTLDAARQIIQALVGCCALTIPGGRYMPMKKGQSIASGLMQALGATESDENRQAIEAMLILLADHELSPGAFSARISASAGSTLHSCIAAALCASSGVEVGRLYSRVGKFLDGARTRSALITQALDVQARGGIVPGFVHPFYPSGDPRAALLLAMARKRREGARQLAPIFDFLDEMEERFKVYPRHEFAVVMLLRAMGLSQHAGGAIFVLARTAGWVAHVQEQRLTGSLLRPRAKFIGASSSTKQPGVAG